MGIIALDNFVDVAGTLAINHTPTKGGPIVSNASAFSAVITNANRLRGQDGGFSFFSYSAVPSTAFYTVEATVYPMTLVNGFGMTARQAAGPATGGSGIFINYTASNTRWTIAGPGISGDSAFQSFTAGTRITLQLLLTPGLCTFNVNGVQLFQKTVTGTPIVGLAGLSFGATDTDSTGFQFESFQVSEYGELEGRFDVQTALGATTDNQPGMSGTTVSQLAVAGTFDTDIL